MAGTAHVCGSGDGKNDRQISGTWMVGTSPHPTVLSEGGPRASSLRSVSDVAHSLCAIVLQSERPRDGGHALRDRVGPVGVRLSGPLPDETLNFRFDRGSPGHLERGLRLQEGTIASSIMRRRLLRERCTRRRWYFGMKVPDSWYTAMYNVI